MKLRLSLRQDDPAYGWKAAALARHGFASSQLFPLRMQAAPWELLHYAGLCVAEVGNAAEADSLAERLFKQDDFPRELQPAALEAVIRACQAAQQAYASSLDADRAELEALEQQQQVAGSSSSGAAPSRRQQVLQVLVYERQVRGCGGLAGLGWERFTGAACDAAACWHPVMSLGALASASKPPCIPRLTHAGFPSRSPL